METAVDMRARECFVSDIVSDLQCEVPEQCTRTMDACSSDQNDTQLDTTVLSCLPSLIRV
jgi:hypothetical protein